MKSMLIIASLIAVAVAGPAHRALVLPSPAGPAPVIEESPIAIGPAIVEGIVPVHPVIDIPAADGTPLVQIILNINGADVEVIAPSPAEAPVVPEVIVPGPVNVVDSVDVGSPVVPAPVVIGTPSLPEVVPGPVNVVDNVEPVVVEPVVVGTPIIPVPAVVLPESLN